MSKNNKVVNEHTIKQVAQIKNPKAFDKVGKLVFILASCKQAVSKNGKPYYVCSYEYKYTKLGNIESFEMRINSMVDLSSFVHQRIIAQVKISDVFNKEKNRSYENYFILEAKLTKQQPERAV